ncbi:hypothetical protein EVU91_11700 [Macrococcoides bohemicum]|uniref:hypothetical protein n=1 Tax=Macrococcoides bohemicum TaxID=1903056 RepID=UPI0010594FDB|nr:hypothetical protein [Macrococcus bohemicus]TDL35707.1 hypothetical protein EVU91_11700 [Macrococcus bohemicus]
MTMINVGDEVRVFIDGEFIEGYIADKREVNDIMYHELHGKWYQENEITKIPKRLTEYERKTFDDPMNSNDNAPDDDSQFVMMEQQETPSNTETSEYGHTDANEPLHVEGNEQEVIEADVDIQTEDFIPEKCDDSQVLYAQLEMHIEMANRCVKQIGVLIEDGDNHED